MKIYFHNDMDGRASAAIVNRYYRDCEDDGTGFKFIELDYKDEVDVDAIQQNEQVIIVDFSFTPDVMELVLQRTKNIIWIDHHKTADDYKYSQELDGLRITEDKEFAGCELTWMYFFHGEEMPEAVKLIGDHDKWRGAFGEDTAKFNMGMQAQSHQPKDIIWEQLFEDIGELVVFDIMEEGEVCIKFRDNFCKDYADSYGFETEFEGYRCFALGLYMFGSEAFGNRFDEYDICISYEWLGNKWVVGLYSREVDVGKIAVKYGKKYKTSGGGHFSAAGFTAPELPFTREKK